MKKDIIHRKMVDMVYAIGLRQRGERAYTLAILPSMGYWYADPIVAEIDGETYLFAEAFDRFREKGCIAAFALEVTEEGIRCGKPRKVLEEPFHLSFPVIFQREGQYYMMPESSADQSLRIYKMGKTPYEWELVRRIPMENSVDTVIVPTEEGYFFLNTQEHPVETLRGKLRLYYTDDFLTGELTDLSHLLEPNDYELTKRNGGPVYEQDGHLYRICQNSTAEFYGFSYSGYRIEALSKTAYQETYLGTVEPKALVIDRCPENMEIYGTHTYSRTAKVEAIDVGCYDCSAGNVLPKILRKFLKKK